MRRLFLILGLAGGLGTAAVLAQPKDEPPRGGRPPGAPDLDRRPANSLFDAIDKNHDEQLSAEEIANAATSLKRLDKNGDGKLTAEELRSSGPDAGSPRDNGQPDGDHGPHGFRGPGPGRPRPDEGRGPVGRPSPDRFVEHALSFDADGDGKLSRDELLNFAKELGPPPGGGRHRGLRSRGGHGDPGGRGPDDGPGFRERGGAGPDGGGAHDEPDRPGSGRRGPGGVHFFPGRFSPRARDFGPEAREVARPERSPRGCPPEELRERPEPPE